MWRELHRRGIHIGKERVRLMMQQAGILARGKRKFRVTTTDSNHGRPTAPNLLNRNFSVEKPNKAWTGDVTYIATDEGWLYLAVVIDLFSRRNAVSATSATKIQKLAEYFPSYRSPWC